MSYTRQRQPTSQFLRHKCKKNNDLPKYLCLSPRLASIITENVTPGSRFVTSL